ncbi:hypothetical protein LPB72_11250 [Hydrogenophaga crassostreae]|uniref:HTH araC/xylS-type domain-containing protein n=1 Tax=Hydrogenophaga crassostreae TaxID=1763535 RepID=A0A162P6M4_9BURK|nr:helix-turn-helix transcriptional regulator [Hydrogenophaga crassostreae]AOW13570.1 hypothetical protein LPB072_12630 [Hydrogenophaga crassostreae]OAD41864.1 hypothetical protein LPB72_11250 [Hydrogenophaga crassostreae]
MSDFSAGAVRRLVPLGLKRQGISMPVGAAPRAAHIAVYDKRQMLAAIAAAHGEHALVRLGEGIADAPDEPMLTAMRFASDPLELIARWQRLECYVHSNHRVRIEQHVDRQMQLQHLSLNGDAAPLRHEDLLILGLLIGLLEWTGTRGLKARLSGERGWRYQNHQWKNCSWPQQLGCWEFAWTGSTPLAPEPDGTDSAEGNADPTDCLQVARYRLSQDPARPWTVAVLAKQMNMASRSLQRALARQQSSFSALLAQTRATSAAQALTTTQQSPAQIGYACGYADQAHFGRDFKRHTALTPLQYRAEFTVGLAP